jgi:hypothetical protein
LELFAGEALDLLVGLLEEEGDFVEGLEGLLQLALAVLLQGQDTVVELFGLGRWEDHPSVSLVF